MARQIANSLCIICLHNLVVLYSRYVIKPSGLEEQQQGQKLCIYKGRISSSYICMLV